MGPVLYEEEDTATKDSQDDSKVSSGQHGRSTDTAGGPAVSDYRLFKSLDLKVTRLSARIATLNTKLKAAKMHDLLGSLDSIRHSSDYPKYVASIKDYVDQDDDTESSSGESYSYIEGPSVTGNENNVPRRLTKYQSWLVQRCQFHAKWSWLLSEIQSTEFRLKHLKKYSDDIKYPKRKFACRSDINVGESARSRYMKLEKRRRVQTHNLLSPDLIKFVSPLYSNDDNSSDKFVQCRCRLGDTGPCILCCGMKNKTLESNVEFLEEDDMWKASLLDNSIHRKLSNISDVRNQIKRNVLFNGYIKSNENHWSYPRVRTSFSPILTTPSQPKTDMKNQINSISLEFAGFQSGDKKFNAEFASDFFQSSKNETVLEDSFVEKSEIKLPCWQINKNINESYQNDFREEICASQKYKVMSLNEDICDEAYIRRHAIEEVTERRRNYPLMKTNVESLSDRVRYFHGFEYKQSTDYGFDVRLFPLPSDDERQLSRFNISYQRSKRLKKKLNQF